MNRFLVGIPDLTHRLVKMSLNSHANIFKIHHVEETETSVCQLGICDVHCMMRVFVCFLCFEITCVSLFVTCFEVILSSVELIPELQFKRMFFEDFMTFFFVFLLSNREIKCEIKMFLTCLVLRCGGTAEMKER